MLTSKENVRYCINIWHALSECRSYLVFRFGQIDTRYDLDPVIFRYLCLLECEGSICRSRDPLESGRGWVDPCLIEKRPARNAGSAKDQSVCHCLLYHSSQVMGSSRLKDNCSVMPLELSWEDLSGYRSRKVSITNGRIVSF